MADNASRLAFGDGSGEGGMSGGTGVLHYALVGSGVHVVILVTTNRMVRMI